MTFGLAAGAIWRGTDRGCSAALPAESLTAHRRQTMAGAGRRASRSKENDMRTIFIAAVMGLGIGVCAVTPSLAAPAAGAATATAAEFARPVEQVYWRPYRHRHWWRHHWHHRWWY
jgi:hypothetical protein